jgi:hypothetical protein
MQTLSRRFFASCLLAAAITITAFAISASATAPLKITNCNKTASRPKLLTLTCGDGNTVLKGMSWSSFGGLSAAGKGTFVTNTCEPNCQGDGLKDLQRRRQGLRQARADVHQLEEARPRRSTQLDVRLPNIGSAATV